MLAMPSFLADMVQPSASENISRAISIGLAVRLSLLAQLDEVGILGEAAGIDVERNAVLPAHRRHRAHVGQRHRLAAAGVVGDGEHAQRDLLPAHLGDELLQRRHVHVALERDAGSAAGGLRG